MNRIIIIVCLAVIHFSLQAGSYQIASPDGSIHVEVYTELGNLYYQLSKEGETLILKSGLGLETSLFGISDFGEIKSVEELVGVDIYKPYWGITKLIDEAYNQLNISFIKGVSVEFRVYNRGMAWRYVSQLNEDFVVMDELAELKLKPTDVVYFPQASGFSTPFEANYIPHQLSNIQEKLFGITPLLVKTSSGTVMVISEVNLKNYPGMFMNLNHVGLRAAYPKFPEREKEQLLGRLRLTNIPQLSKKEVKKEEDFIAKCKGEQQFPWRAILIESSEINLLNNNLIASLAEKPDESEDYSWVKPGKVVWDWYHKWNLAGVDFKAGINTATYKYMIDFASENKLEYVNIDDGWCDLHDFRKINKNLNLTEVLHYAAAKDIGIFLWCTWQTLEDDLDANLDYFKNLGVAGLKVDFFDRADQAVVDFVNLLASECAKRHLLLNLHGMYKPTGIQISYPNVVNLEGILGLEYNKFSEDCTPVHNATVAYTRNVVGPMDYTPGGMRFVNQEDFKASWSEPHVMTTKTQQMAMYVVFHGGVQMLADSPTLYEKDAIALDFLRDVPVTWDETVPVEGTIGEYVIVARRSGEDWYLAGLNAEEGREYLIETDFLLHGEKYEMELLTDGDIAEDMVYTKQIMTEHSILKIKTKSAGGFVAHFTR